MTVTEGLSSLQETAIWPVSACRDWSDLLLLELQTPAYINSNSSFTTINYSYDVHWLKSISWRINKQLPLYHTFFIWKCHYLDILDWGYQVIPVFLIHVHWNAIHLQLWHSAFTRPISWITQAWFSISWTVKCIGGLGYKISSNMAS